MKRRFKISAALSLVLAFVLALSVSSAGKTVSTHAAAGEWENVEIASEYRRGTEFTVPERNYILDGKVIAAGHVLTFPDGTATAKNSVTLDMLGIYKLKYTASYNGYSQSDEIVFDVFTPFAAVSSEKSSAAYKDVSVTFPWECWNGGVKHGEGTVDFEKSGIFVRLAEGDSVEFETIIDVSTATKNDTLVAVTAIPDVIGEADFGGLEFTFTDSVDPSVQLRVAMNHYIDNEQIAEGYPFTYIRAGGQNQARAGYEQGKKLVHIENTWGSSQTHSFTGVYADPYGRTFNNVDTDQTIRLKYDASENALYNAAFDSDGGPHLVIDFDNAQHFSTLWDGFPSGKVRMKVNATRYVNDTANFLIHEIAGINLNQAKFSETDAPVITVDCKYDKMPDAKQGGTYPVPTATAYDDYSGTTKVTSEVWFNYNTSAATRVTVNNGRFATDRAGYYTIVYKSADFLGNEAAKELWIKCFDEITEPQVAVTGAKPQSYKLGEAITLPEVSVGGGTGELEVKATARLNGTEREIADGYIFEEAGEWTIEFTVTDFIGQRSSAEFTVEAVANPDAVFMDKPSLPTAFLSGSKYVLPELYANDYSTGKLEKVKATARITDANGQSKELNAGDEFMPEVNANGDTVYVEYRVSNGSKTYEVPAILPFDSSTGWLVLENYFITRGVEIEKTRECTVVTATESDGYFMFANPLLAEGAKIELRTPQATSNYGGIKLVFTDMNDSSISIEANVRNLGNLSALEINGKRATSQSGFSFDDRNNSFTVGLSGTTFTLAGEPVTVNRLDDGRVFDGFPSGKFYMSVGFIGATANSSKFEVYSINGQPTLFSISDNIEPNIAVLGDYGGWTAFGEIVKLAPASAGDVLDPNVTFTLSVVDPDGEFVTDENGVKLQNVDPTVGYEFKLAKRGRYFVNYVATDTFGDNVKRFSYQITTEDKSVPVITADGEWKTSAKVGEEYVFPKITVTDEYGEVTTVISVTYPNGKTVLLKNGTNTLVFGSAGRYRITVMCFDESGNTATQTVYVDVE